MGEEANKWTRLGKPQPTHAKAEPPMSGPSALQDWMERQYHASAKAMMSAISATHLVKDRRAFGQVVRPVRGSVLASPVIASYDPDPDYFFHWARDSAVVMDALRLLIERGTLGDEALSHLQDFVAFSLALLRLDGETYLQKLGDFRGKVEPFYLQYVRDDKDLRAIKGERVQGEPRFNPDGTLDILKWSRPQHDGPASRALTLLRFWPLVEARAPAFLGPMQELLEADLGFVLRHWNEPSFDIWEEELGQHYYTRLLHRAALEDGAKWFEAHGEELSAKACRAAAIDLSEALDAHWSPEKGLYLSRIYTENGSPEKELDIATILAVIHAARGTGPHSVLDPRAHATLEQLEALFAALYPINKALNGTRAPALGRYQGDRYYSGGAYYFSTLGATEFYFRLAAAVSSGADLVVTAENEPFRAHLAKDDALEGTCTTREDRARLVKALVSRGDAFMATVAAYTPSSGDLSEQFDQETGTQTSAKNLAWSHAAFISAFAARERIFQESSRT
jgi:glucoamylase